MSRIGKNPIPIPDGVKVHLKGNEITVEGPKGKLSMNFHPDMKVTVDEKEKQIRVERPTERAFHKALHGTTAALIRNMVKGVTEGFTVVLEVQGLGYRAAVKGNALELSLGKSHPDIYPIPKGISIEVKGNEIHVSGVDKQMVGQVAAEIRAFRKPDPYKGKGIRYKGEALKLKPGKAAGKK
ncbi:LSU ribosomal protein L6P [Hydrogenivirga caldilitoris]|uniref:Large ribosomal subunit protein uL6 n=1 Tax=Hydrogenivirga caldilitoris TaxID=246264 RepID=A0A497XNU8_9AQUI|nr:50S ribosomal protein L6 [Hydrogenivirga caldilitoris]RLJ69810.1 LSU ribosomal protein L6P [Hydrogenivirga caldilitoris]